MTFLPCSRLWQVEAIRDGRLSGKDLEVAERHRELCHDCAEEARRLTELTHGFAGLPELLRGPLAVRRSRQALMAAVNDSLLTSTAMRFRSWTAALALLPCAVLGYALLVWHSAAPLPAALPKSAVEVRAQAGARWVVQNRVGLEQVQVSDGEVSFKVHSHPDRRVLVLLPDGEIEDLGTTFEVAVHDQHTSHIAVSEGRVTVRLSNQPEFILAAGEHWETPVAAPAPRLLGPESPAQPERAAQAIAPKAASVALRASANARPATAAAATAPSAALDTESTRAEDNAYLAVVALLRRGRTAEARAQAKAYLLRFPRGFRRVEMLNVATNSDGDSAAPDAWPVSRP
ncbi:MAG: FecR family protein [Polyangiaceae bacterium]